MAAIRRLFPRSPHRGQGRSYSPPRRTAGPRGGADLVQHLQEACGHRRRLAVRPGDRKRKIRAAIAQRQVAHPRDAHAGQRRGQQRQPQAGGHQADLRGGFARGLHDAGHEAGRARQLLQHVRQAGAGAGRKGDELLLGQLGEAHRRALRQPVGGGHDQQQRFARQFAQRDARRRRSGAHPHQAHVQLAFGQRGELRGGEQFAQLQADFRMAAAEGRQQVRHDLGVGQ